MTVNAMVDRFAPPDLLPWLQYENMLTDKLQEQSGDARVQVLQQHTKPVSVWEQSTLAIKDSEVMHRDVLIFSQQNPCWFARTIIPQGILMHHKTLFQRLQNESLGKVVFNNPLIKRIKLHHYWIEPDSEEYSWLPIKSHFEILWLRRSHFIINDYDVFYLTEILLPDLLRYSC